MRFLSKTLSLLVAGALMVSGWGVEAITVDANGNVGVGQSTPTAGLHISREGSAYADGSYLWVNCLNTTIGGGAAIAGITCARGNSPDYHLLKIGNGGSAEFVIRGDGFVGIGTDNPQSGLHLISGDSVGRFESLGSNAFMQLMTSEGEANRVEIANRSGGRLALWTADGGDSLSISKSGNVGIGCSSSVDPNWNRHLVIGADGKDKAMIGYVDSISNKVTVGAQVSSHGGWAPIQISGTNVSLSYMETPVVEVTNGEAAIHGNMSFDSTGDSYIYFRDGAVNKFSIKKSAVGDALEFHRYDNSGNWAGSLLGMNRGTGKVTVGVDFHVNGNATCTGGWADYVFADDYELADLDEVESFIDENGHLKGVPSSEEIGKSGINFGRTFKVQMEKIEELTLYAIQAKKERDAALQKTEDVRKKSIVLVDQANERISTLEARLAALEKLLISEAQD